MADYQLTAGDSVIRTSDGARVPNASGNRDRIVYEEWLAAGNSPDAFVPPLQQNNPEDALNLLTVRVLFNHENRIRLLESKAPITMPQFIAALRALMP